MEIVSRVKNILLSPHAEWKAIAGESATTRSLYTDYIVPMSAIPPVCALIGMSIFVGSIGFGSILGVAVLQYLLGLVAVYIVALIAQKLAPSFGGRGDFIQALKLIAYAYTASWLGGIFFLIPFLGLVSLLLSLYSLYLLYAGTTPVMGVEPNRAVAYTVVVVICVIIIFLAISYLMGFVLGMSMMRMG